MLKARLLSPGLPPWQCTDKGRPIPRSSCSRWSQPRCRSLCCKWPGQLLQGRPPRPSWWDLVASCPVVALLTVAWPLQSQCLLLHPLMRWESSHYWNFQSRPRTVSLPSSLLSLHTFTFPSHFTFLNMMRTLLPGVPAAACGQQPSNANPPGSTKPGPNDMPALLQRINTGETGGTSSWLVPRTGSKVD